MAACCGADSLSRKENRVYEDLDSTDGEGHLLGEQITTDKRKAGGRVRIGAADGSLTGLAGLAAVDALVDRLGLVRELDAGIGPIKVRDRGLAGGQLVAGMATGQLAGADCLAGLDRVRGDVGASLLGAAPVPASRTAGRLAGAFGPARLAGIETGLAAVYRRWLALAPAEVRAPLVLRDPTIDLDASDIEVFGHTKQNVGWNYAGMRCGRVHLASWAGAELPLAADLIAGNDDVRPDAPGLLARALAALPPQVCGRRRVRADAGYFDATLAHAAVDADCDFAVAAKRNPAAWRALASVDETYWQPARGMPGGQVAACDYAPAGWPPGTSTIVRRVKVDAEHISADGRSRRRRTIAKDQLALALAGDLDHAWAVSFIVTNIPANQGDYVGLQAWFRNRTSIEDRFREAKHGAGLIHLPSAAAAVNSVWMWAGLIAGALAVMLQSITGLDRNPHRVRIQTLRHQLINIPGRLTHHARTPVPATTTPPTATTPRAGRAASTARPHLTAANPPRDPRTGDTDHRVGRSRTPTHPRRSTNRERSLPAQDHQVTGGSRSD